MSRFVHLAIAAIILGLASAIFIPVSIAGGSYWAWSALFACCWFLVGLIKPTHGSGL